MKNAYLYTFGCKVNQYETQLFRQYLFDKGYQIVSSIEAAELIVINSCTVTGEADRQCRQLIRQITRKNPSARIMVTGCYAVRAAGELTDLGDRIEIIADKKEYLRGITAITEFSGHARAFVKVQDGCDAFCSYCIVPYVRSVLWSRPEKDIEHEIEDLIAKGYAEIVLSGVRLGKYQGGLVNLLRKLVALQGSYRLRLSSLEIKEVGGDLVELMVSEKSKICAHLHLPLQSGSDKILTKMKRPYSTNEFAARLSEIYRAIPDIGVSTDVIVGFPGETDDEFEATVRFIEENSFSRLHVFPFSPRSGTPAASMPGGLPKDIVRERARRLRELDARLQDNFWRRFKGTARPAVREGANLTFITDNYIRLTVAKEAAPSGHSIDWLPIEEKDGKAWGVPA